MSKSSMLLVVLLVFINSLIGNAHISVHVMVLHSTQGSFANVTDFQTLTPHWYEYMYMYEYMYVYMYTYIYVFIYAYIYFQTYVYTSMYVYECVHI
jgi:hypothetical protein